MSLPPFLQPRDPPHLPTASCRNALFLHKLPFGSSHALWWPSKLPLPTTVVLFIPGKFYTPGSCSRSSFVTGNPGLLDLYVPFLEFLYAKDTSSSLAIFAGSHIGHTPGIEANTSGHGLPAQIESSIEAFDAIQSNFGAGIRIVVAGHSVGSWLSLQILKARPSAVAGVFLLFPTISHIRDTPNGRMLSILPLSVLALFFPSWSLSQVLVFQTFLHSPSSILAALRMADDEMHTIRGLDVPLLTAHRDRLWFYFAEHDDWVGEQLNHVLDSFEPELEKFRIVHGQEVVTTAIIQALAATMDAGGPSSDPALFFTPEKSLPPSHHPELSPQPLKATGTVPAQRAFFILAPHIADEEKKLYKPAEASSLKHDSEMLLDEVIGHYREHDISYYYARYQGGLAHKVPGIPSDRKDAAGELEPFDPSAHYIHPSSRVKFTVSINNRRATVNISSARSIKSVSGLETVPDSEEEKRTDVDDESDNDESDFEEEEQSFRRRTSGRVSVTRKQTLPFSPKKTRSARVFVIDSDLETGASDKNVTIIPTRRSSRNTKRNRKELKDLDSDDSDADLISYSDADAYAPRTPHTKAKPKKLMGKRESRPAYGHFRSIADLDYDSHSDEETAPMRKHRNICEKCHQPPAHKLLKALSRRGKGRSKKKKTQDEFEESGDEEEKLAGLGGWVRCLKCPVVAHWKCMASVQREEILKAARDRERAEWERNQSHDGDPTPEPAKRSGLTPDQTTEFICGACMKGGFCMFCMEVALEADSVQKEKACSAIKDKATTDDPKENSTLPQSSASENTTDGHCSTKQLLFRCLTCKRLAHYAHLPPSSHNPSRETIAEIAQHYTQTWLCADCASYTFGVDKVIAWRPYPPTVVEPTRDETANYKSFLPREYLVKWIDRSFRRVQWVPHMWLLSTHPAKLKNFLMGGSKVELMKTPDIAELDGDEPDSSDLNHERRASSVNLQANASSLPQNPIPDAERRIPPAWKTVDRLLDVLLWRSQPHHSKQKQKRKGKRRQFSIGTDGSEDDLDEDIEEERELAFDRGEQPSDNLVETVSDWETRTGYSFSEENIRQIAWALIKWEDLGYDEASWDSPPRPNDPTYSAFESALRRYVHSRGVVVPKHSMSYCEKFDKRAKDQYRTRHALKDAADLDIGQDQQLKLMPFQVDGFNWLCNNWWNLQPCILADEMGLGKTVQVATFLGSIVAKFKAFPALVVVPNSTITNWVREFERWAPDLRVVPFYGEAKSREIIKKYELYHQIKRTHETGAKFHVLIATYEALLNPKDFTPVFRNQPRWEVLIIDEGQRLKSDSSLLFKRLNELKSIQRILMTGTPLNNNIRELFNLMNFLDPNEWNDLEGLEKEHEELTEDLVKQLHNRLRPYFLRRLKSEVLQLPPKVGSISFM
ncbi:hypothetical protein C0989_009199 [Termitomyces sp. Mn162]|nr:hypothetical protein C0989_009199 [Termitomyces sp. Mn162]